ncbi:PilZ domain-containing protein [Methylobacterium tarhaniae]|uniref:PilZ domain-containing protein n=1 Tax=Methylobacterium tarhaniae TaxID=1187852 RepID=UPI000A9CE945|nr:PilZ domain-containing protein [Methylobacterium tarhaniae]
MDLFYASRAGSAGSRGEIIFDSPTPVLDCRISNISPFGATLVVPAGTVVPDAITLAIAGEFVMRRCRVVWRRRGRVGVTFVVPI